MKKIEFANWRSLSWYGRIVGRYGALRRRDVRKFWRKRKRFKPTLSAKFYGYCTLGLASVMVLFAPILQTISVPAILKYEHSEIYPIEAGRIKNSYVYNGRQVEKGQVLLTITRAVRGDTHGEGTGGGDLSAYFVRRKTTPALDQNSMLIKSSAKARLQHVQQIKAQQTANLSMLRAPHNAQDIHIKAKHAGVIQEVSPYLVVGKPISTNFRIAKLVNSTRRSVVSYVPMHGEYNVIEGAKFVFVPDKINQARSHGAVTTVENRALLTLKHLRLADQYGGPIQVRIDAKGQSVPKKSYHQVLGSVRQQNPGDGSVALNPVALQASNSAPVSLLDVIGTTQLRVKPYSIVQKFRP